MKIKRRKEKFQTFELLADRNQDGTVKDTIQVCIPHGSE